MGKVDKPTILVNPHGLPPMEFGAKNPVSLFITRRSMFVPDLEDLNNALSVDAEGSSIIQVPSNENVWNCINTYTKERQK